MLIQAALNGTRTRGDHDGAPISIEELSRDAAACVAAGAGATHMHPRDAEGRERLDSDIINAVVDRVRDACGVPVGVSTGVWIEPDLDRRLAMVRLWRAPDYASVNVSEPGWLEVMQALIAAGVGIEAGLATVEDAELLAGSGLGGRVTRVLVEPFGDEASVDEVLTLIGEMHATLDGHGIGAPRLQHSDGPATWPVLVDAIRRGHDTRIGLEDTLFEQDGTITAGNEALVRAAIRIRSLAERSSQV